MEDKARRKVLVVIGIILVIIFALAYVLSLFVAKDDDSILPSNPDPDRSNETFREEITLLEDETLFFGVQKIINDYYNSIFEEDTQTLLSILDPLYIKENQIVATNIYSILGNDYEITSYLAKEVYYNPDSSVTYYFVSGDLTSDSFMKDNYQFKENLNFLIIVDESNHNYVLRPIKTEQLEEYAKNYDITETEINNDQLFSSIDISLENKLSNYLAIFINFLIDYPIEAYQMLDESTKNRYVNYDDFASHNVELYQSFSSKIFSYSSTEENDITIYEVVDDNQNRVTIYEYAIMDYKIHY